MFCLKVTLPHDAQRPRLAAVLGFYIRPPIAKARFLFYAEVNTNAQ